MSGMSGHGYRCQCRQPGSEDADRAEPVASPRRDQRAGHPAHRRPGAGELGVEADCVSDIEIALTEACTNVLDHVGADDEYDVTLQVRDDLCVIEVIDTGHGFDAAIAGPPRRRADAPRRVAASS